MKQESKRVNVPDLRDLIQFWEIRDEIMELLWGLANRGMGFSKFNPDYLADMADKIESIGKKEGES